MEGYGTFPTAGHPVNTDSFELLRTKDAARFLRVSPSTLRRWVRAGSIPLPIKMGSRVAVWRRLDLEQFIANLPSKLPESTAS